MMPTSISQIIEQVFNAAFSIGAAWFFIQQFAANDTEHAKFGAAGEPSEQEPVSWQASALC